MLLSLMVYVTAVSLLLALAAIPVIMLTSSDNPKHAQDAYALGVRRYLIKPADFNELVVVVKETLGHWVDPESDSALGEVPQPHHQSPTTSTTSPRLHRRASRMRFCRSDGDTPGIRPAWARDSGRIRTSFSLASYETLRKAV